MKGKLRTAGIATGVALVIAATVYVYTTPDERTVAGTSSPERAA